MTPRERRRAAFFFQKPGSVGSGGGNAERSPARSRSHAEMTPATRAFDASVELLAQRRDFSAFDAALGEKILVEAGRKIGELQPVARILALPETRPGVKQLAAASGLRHVAEARRVVVMAAKARAGSANVSFAK